MILLTIINQVNPNLQFTIERDKTGAKIWMDICKELTDSKRYVPFTSNHSRSCHRNTQFCLARRICAIVEEENTKLNGCKS